MTAEVIAQVVADIKAGPPNVRLIKTDPAMRRLLGKSWHGADGSAAWQDPPVVDATALYRTIQPSEKLVDLYGDHQCIAPPWERALIGFENRFGNVIVTQMWAVDAGQELADGEPRWETDNPVDWARVRWLIHCFVWIGGRSTTTGQALPTYGPVFMEQYAVYGDGEPADLHWVQFAEEWDEGMAQMHLRINLGVLNFLSCRNVELAEPQRPRPERRRLERIGVRVSEIHVFPVGRSRTAGGRPLDEGGTALHSVRGHFANYGPRYDRGLLFGRYEGRFFRPRHARGSAEHGQIEQSYVLHPEQEAS